jgi:hypothetical protein
MNAAGLLVLTAQRRWSPTLRPARRVAGCGCGSPPTRPGRDDRSYPWSSWCSPCRRHPAAAIHQSLPRLPPAVRPGFAAVAERCAAGVRFADALAALPEALGPVAAPLADTLAAADRYGLPLAPVLERLAGEARLHRRRQAEALARQLPVRLAGPLVLCTLPAFVLLSIVPLLLAALSSLNH